MDQITLLTIDEIINIDNKTNVEEIRNYIEHLKNNPDDIKKVKNINDVEDPSTIKKILDNIFTKVEFDSVCTPSTSDEHGSVGFVIDTTS